MVSYAKGFITQQRTWKGRTSSFRFSKASHCSSGPLSSFSPRAADDGVAIPAAALLGGLLAEVLETLLIFEVLVILTVTGRSVW